MRRMTTLVLAVAAMGFAGVAATPTAALAQCHWGCTCAARRGRTHFRPPSRRG